jgi:hypothetical protein
MSLYDLYLTLSGKTVFPDPFEIAVNRLKDKLSQAERALTGGLPTNRIPFEYTCRTIDSEISMMLEIFVNTDEPSYIQIPLYYKYNLYGILRIDKHASEKADKYRLEKLGTTMYPFPLDKFMGGELYVVEGIFDYIAMYKAGFKNTVCIFGVNNYFSFKYLVEPLNITKLNIVFDGDTAGRTAAMKAKAYLESSIPVEVIDLPDNTDPDSLGVDALKQLLTKQ